MSKGHVHTLDNDLRAFAGLGHGGMLNFAAGDGYFWNSMMDRYKLTDEQLKKELERVRREAGS